VIAPSFFAGDVKEYGIVVASPLKFRGFCALKSSKKGWAEMAVFKFTSGGGAPTRDRQGECFAGAVVRVFTEM
jgi:hypothetical protein